MSKADNDRKTFKTELGSKAVNEHHSIAHIPEVAQLREVLKDMGKDLQRVGAAPKEYAYRGSFSMHVYSSAIAGQLAFVGISAPERMPFDLAEAAVDKMRGDIQMMYLGKMQKLRSGFPGGK